MDQSSPYFFSFLDLPIFWERIFPLSSRTAQSQPFLESGGLLDERKKIGLFSEKYMRFFF